MNEIIEVNGGDRQLQPLSGGIPLDRHPAAVYIASLVSKRSQRVQKQALNVIAEILTNGRADAISCPWHEIRYQHVQAVRAHLVDRFAPSTVNRLLSALRKTIKEAWRLGYIDEEQYRRAIDVPNIKGQTLPAGRSLPSGEIVALVNTCKHDEGPAGVRDAALIGVLCAAGLRREEIVTLMLEDFDPESGQLIVRGKGRKERTSYIEGGAGRALADWLAVRGNRPGALFIGINKGGALDASLKGLSAQAVYGILKKRGMQSGVKQFSPHDLRRTFVSDMLDAGADIATVAQLAGHASVTTTARYDRRPEEAKRKAAGMIHFPY